MLDAGLVAAEDEIRAVKRGESPRHTEAGRIVLIQHDVVEPVAGGVRDLAFLVVGRWTTQQDQLLGTGLLGGAAGQHEGHRDRLAPTPGNSQPGKQPEDRTDAARRVPRLGWLRGRLGNGPQRERVALVRTPAVERGHIRQVGLVDRRRVQRGEVVSLEVPVNRDLPVRPG